MSRTEGRITGQDAVPQYVINRVRAMQKRTEAARKDDNPFYGGWDIGVSDVLAILLEANLERQQSEAAIRQRQAEDQDEVPW